MKNDVVFALRSWRRAPGVFAAVLLTLALGIGGSVAIFSVVSAVLLTPPKVPEPERLVVLVRDAPKQGIVDFALSHPDLVDVSRAASFSKIGALVEESINLGGGARPEQVFGAYATGTLFEVLGVHAALGRTLLPSDEEPGRGTVAVLSHELWKRRFSGDEGVLGRSLLVGGVSVTVVGVMPRGFDLPRPTGKDTRELWLPMSVDFPGLELARLKTSRAEFLFETFARLAPGATLERARAEVQAIGAREARDYPELDEGWFYRVSPLTSEIVKRVRPTLLLLLAAVGFVLLIACANVANLLLARAGARRRELAVRASLGATRARLLRQLLTESVLLACLGGALGLAVAWGGTRALAAAAPDTLRGLASSGLGLRVLLFALALSTATGVLFGLVPALSSSRPDLVTELKEGGRGGSAGTASGRLRSTLVVVEIALALVLLVGAGLMVKSLKRLLAVDPGFDTANLLAATASLDEKRYPGEAPKARFVKEVVRRISALPGVKAGGAIDLLPLSGESRDWKWTFEVEGEPFATPAQRPLSHRRSVLPGTLEALGLRRIAGRTLVSTDTADAPFVLVVSETLAKQHGGVQAILGKRVNFEDPPAKPIWRQVVGVVRNVRMRGLDEGPEADSYEPFEQSPNVLITLVSFVARTAGDPALLAGALRAEVAGVDRDQPLFEVRPMSVWVEKASERERLAALLLGLFAVVALALASVGTYGVLSYGVVQRTREIGIRMALGASSRDVVSLVLGQAARLSLLGLAIGTACAAALSRVLSGVLAAFQANDPPTFAGAAALLAATALVAGLLPALRAARVPPMTSLRSE